MATKKKAEGLPGRDDDFGVWMQEYLGITKNPDGSVNDPRVKKNKNNQQMNDIIRGVKKKKGER